MVMTYGHTPFALRPSYNVSGQNFSNRDDLIDAMELRGYRHVGDTNYTGQPELQGQPVFEGLPEPSFKNGQVCYGG